MCAGNSPSLRSRRSLRRTGGKQPQTSIFVSSVPFSTNREQQMQSRRRMCGGTYDRFGHLFKPSPANLGPRSKERFSRCSKEETCPRVRCCAAQYVVRINKSKRVTCPSQGARMVISVRWGEASWHWLSPRPCPSATLPGRLVTRSHESSIGLHLQVALGRIILVCLLVERRLFVKRWHLRNS